MLSNKRVLVTGAAGLVGSTICDRLIDEGVSEIVAFDNLSRGPSPNLDAAQKSGSVTLVNGDIGNRDLISKSMQGIDVVFHQAAIRVTLCAEDPRLAMEVLVDGSFNVFEAAVAAKVQKVIAASSASVYGMATVFPTPEDHPLHTNRTIYGAAKAFNEQTLRAFNDVYGLKYVALRYFNIYGERMNTQGAHTEVLIKWMNRIASGQAPLILGDGSTSVDFIHIDDIARANILAAKSGISDEVFNVGSGVETTLNQLASALLKIMGSNLKPEYGPARGVNAVPRRVADTTKAQTMLGFQSKVSLEEGLTRLYTWWKEQQ